jgi:outer membrane protein assembly factor BamB
MDGAVLVDVVPPGSLEAPSGLEVRNGLLYVSDNVTSRFHAFDMMSGQLVRTLDTGLPPGSLAGLTFGPDGKVYFVDILSARVYRIDPK